MSKVSGFCINCRCSAVISVPVLPTNSRKRLNELLYVSLVPREEKVLSYSSAFMSFVTRFTKGSVITNERALATFKM